MMRFLNSAILATMLAATLMAGCTPVATPMAPTQEAQVVVDSATPTEPPVSPTLIPTEKATSWEIVIQTEVKQPIRMAAFLNENFGVMGGAGSSGRAHHTTDGSENWVKADSSAGCIYGVDIIDTQTVWQCSAGSIRVSTDGAQTWQETLEKAGGSNCQLSFVDDKAGWVSSSKWLKATTDGGESWEDIVKPEGIEEYIAAISLRTLTDGYLLDISGTLYTTQDGGQSWSSSTLGLGEILPPAGAASAAVRFLDADRGIVVVNIAGDDGKKVVVAHTEDGGETWEYEDIMPTKYGSAPYLSHDGKLLTITSAPNKQITLLHLEQ